MRKPIDLTGQRFGRLTVTEKLPSVNRQTMWWCKCDCGNDVAVRTDYLLSKHTQSCGCLRKLPPPSKTHGEGGTRLYRIWCTTRNRCEQEKTRDYKWCGGKGIKVCDEWRFSYETFRDWAVANGYSDDLNLCRFDKSKDYCPENCRWVTRQERYEIQNKRRRKECRLQ